MARRHIKVGGTIITYSLWRVGQGATTFFALGSVAMKIAEVVVIAILVQTSSGQGTSLQMSTDEVVTIIF